MKRTGLLIIVAISMNACHRQGETQEAEFRARTDIELTGISYGSINDDLELFASTVYLKRNVVAAPIPAFITNVNVRLGDKVKKGDVLFELESKERQALGNQVGRMDTSLSSFGRIRVKAQTAGIVSTLDKQQTGDYVLEGAQLCTISESNNLAFQVNVPYEFIKYVKPGKSCRIVMPDNTVQSAVISTPLSNMNLAAQTQSVLARSTSPLFLPENLIVKVLVNKGDDSKKQVLPLTCVQSDEMMKEFWIMKMINDSTAVRVYVVPGNKDRSQVEILKPKMDSTFRIILKGSYGLPDTAYVNIVSERNAE